MCCASAGAERRGGVLCAGPAYVIPQAKKPHSLLHNQKTSSMSKDQTAMPAGVKRPAAGPADPPPHLPLHLAASPALVLPNIFTKDNCKKCANPALEKNYGFCLTHREKGGHRAKKPKTARQPSTGSVAGVKVRLCHRCKEKKGLNCEDGCIEHASYKRNRRV